MPYITLEFKNIIYCNTIIVSGKTASYLMQTFYKQDQKEKAIL